MVFARLAGEAGFVLGEGAQARAADVLRFEANGQRESAAGGGMLSMITAAQARRDRPHKADPVAYH